MKSVTRITVTDDNGIKFFGEGPWRLLRCVEKTGSLRAAAMEMEMAYSKAIPSSPSSSPCSPPGS